MADTSLKANAHEGHIGIKKLFYVLRPLLACRWIARTRTQPPTQFGALVAVDWVTNEEKAWIAELLQQKAQAVEAQQVQLEAGKLAAIRAELDHYKTAANSLPAPAPTNLQALDAVLQMWVRDSSA